MIILDSQARTSLTDVLLKLDVCKNSQKFGELVEQLSFGEALDIAGSARDRTRSLVDYCSTNDRFFHDLFYALQGYAQLAPQQLAPLATVLDRVLGRAIGFSEWESLDRLLDGAPTPLPDPVAVAAFRRVATHDQMPQPLAKPDVPVPFWRTAVEYLSGKHLAGEPDGSHPLMGFLWICRGAMDPATVLAVDSWEGTVATRLKRDLAKLRGLVGAAESFPSLGFFNRLQIVIEQPTECDPDQPVYRLRAWFRPARPDLNPTPIQLAGGLPEPQAAEVLRESLPELVRSAQQLDAHHPLWVEVALPLELFSLEFETVPWEAGSQQRCGGLVPLIIRSLDRLPHFGRNCCTAHQQKWKQLEPQVLRKDIFWAPDRDDLSDALAIFSPAPLVLGASGDPFSLQGVLLDHAVPLAIWLHEKPKKLGAARDSLVNEFAGRDHREWPLRALKLRQKPDSLLSRFTLLWDDPTSVPPMATTPLRNPI